MEGVVWGVVEEGEELGGEAVLGGEWLWEVGRYGTTPSTPRALEVYMYPRYPPRRSSRDPNKIMTKCPLTVLVFI